MKTFGVHGDCQNKDSPTASRGCNLNCVIKE